MDTSAYGTIALGYFFQKCKSYFVFHESIYQICEVYIDDLFIYGTDDGNFVKNA